MLPVKRAIMILLSLMVGLVLVVSWLMASANLEFAEKAKESNDVSKNKTVQEIDREKLEKKFSNEDKGKLN